MQSLRCLAAMTFLAAPNAFAAEEPTQKALGVEPSAASVDPEPTPAAPRVPYLGEEGQQKYQEYLSRPLPRAFAISESGHYGAAFGTKPANKSMSADPKRRALQYCRQRSRSECVLYSVDDQVVFSSAAGAVPAAHNRAPLPPPIVTWVFEIAVDIGTNELYHIIFQDGSKQSIGANTGAGLSLGVSALPLAGGRLRTRVMLGAKGTFQNATNGSIDYYAFPLEALETLELGPIRLGAGLFALLDPSLHGSGVASSITAAFDSTAGFEGRVEAVFGRTMSLGLRFIWNKISLHGVTITNAPAIGFVLSYNGRVGD